MASVPDSQQALIQTYIITSASVIFFYDSVITLCDEVNVVWRRKWTTMTWVYALTRYSTLLLNIIVFPTYGNIESCKAAIYTQNVLGLISFLCFALFSAFRVYALSDGRYIIAALVFLLNLVPFATNMFNSAIVRIIVDSEICTYTLSESADLGLSLTLISRISVIISDILVLVVTWMKTAQSYREARRLKIKAPLSMMLIRDGTLYFVILLIMNVLEVLGDNIPMLFALDAIGPFFDFLPPLIVCRFILSLRQVNPAANSWISRNQSHTLRFVGNMGESLRFGDDEEEDIEIDGHEEHAAAADGLSELHAAEATTSGEADKGEARVHSDFGIQEVPRHHDV